MNTLALKRKACKNENQPIALMTEGSIFKSILFFSVPLILGNLLQQMYNAVDSIIVILLAILEVFTIREYLSKKKETTEE